MKQKFNQSLLTVVVMSFALLIPLTAFGLNQGEARKGLEKQNIPFAEDEFIDRARQGDINAINLLITAGINPNVAEIIEGKTALMWAAEFGDIDTVRALLSWVANVDTKNKRGSTALMFAAKGGYAEIVKLFLKKGADVNAKNNLGRTPLLGAALSGNTTTVKLLMDAGADVHVSDIEGNTPLKYAILNGFTDIAQLLRKAGAHGAHIPIESTEEIYTPEEKLISRAGQGDLQGVKSLLDDGINPNAANKDGLTALKCAAMRGYLNIVRVLQERGADINAKCTDGSTYLMDAAVLGKKDIVRFLLDENVAVNEADKIDRTALMYTAASGQTEIARMLLDRDAQINAVNKDGGTPLIIASFNGNTSLVRLLIERGANVNAADIKGMTSLMWAAAYGYTTIVRTLLATSADIKMTEKNGMNALILAAENNRTEIVQLLKDAETKISSQEGPLKVTLDQALKASPLELAQGYLVVSYNLTCAEVAEGGATIDTTIDGREQVIDKSNAAIYIAGFKERLQIYTTAIKQRGYRQIAGEYNTKVSSGCKNIGFSKGTTIIGQDEFKVNISQGSFQEIKHRGIVVESSLVVEHAMNPEILLVGKIAQNNIELKHLPSKCTITLTQKK